MTKEPTPADSVVPHLSLWDAVSIIVGIVVGTSIFKVPQLIFGNVQGAWQGLGCWALGGALALIGSLCYAELATTYPRMGGDYVYLSRAFGRWMGFLFGWAQLAVILTGSIAAMGYAFGDHAVKLWGLHEDWSVWFAAGAVIVLTLLNLSGLILGKSAQNLLTGVKIVGLAAIVVAGAVFGGQAALTNAVPLKETSFGFAMVMVLYAYGGWNDAAFVAAEVRNRGKNMPLALLLGTGGITLIYLIVNAAYLWGLGLDGVRAAGEPAAELFGKALGPKGAKAISLLVMLSALGAINGLIFTGSRIYVSLGKDHRVFAWLGRWSLPRSAPVRSLLAQGAITLLLIWLVGTNVGRTTIDQSLQAIGLSPLPWKNYFGGFNTLVAGSAPVFWVFFLLTGISLFVLRFKDRGIQRPFSAPLYPLEPIVFCAMCGYMLYSAVDYAKGLSLLGVVPLLIGVPLYLVSQWVLRPSSES